MIINSSNFSLVPAVIGQSNLQSGRDPAFRRSVPPSVQVISNLAASSHVRVWTSCYYVIAILKR